MPDHTYWSGGGTIKRTIHTDSSNPYAYAQSVELWYDDGFEQRNRDLEPYQTGDMKLIARGVPFYIWEQSEREGWDEKRWSQWLNDSDNAAFRVWRGVV